MQQLCCISYQSVPLNATPMLRFLWVAFQRCPVHIATQLRCCDPRGATSCGSPMPRAEQFANPTERDRRLAGSFFKRTADRLARLGRTEEHREPDMLRRIVSGPEDLLCYPGQRLHSLTAARTGAHEDQLADEIGRLERDFLRDHPTDREAEDIDFAQTKGSD